LEELPIKKFRENSLVVLCSSHEEKPTDRQNVHDVVKKEHFYKVSTLTRQAPSTPEYATN
jgi:hypothetical protein